MNYEMLANELNNSRHSQVTIDLIPEIRHSSDVDLYRVSSARKKLTVHYYDTDDNEITFKSNSMTDFEMNEVVRIIKDNQNNV